jgi:NAD-dependent deacetylase
MHAGRNGAVSRFELDDRVKQMLQAFAAGHGRLTVLTGAGISAESGIPTFRGPEGYWTVGSREYHPQEMATYAMFRKKPLEVWRWYLYRRHVCGAADPNDGHRALAGMERLFEDRFTLITQNVDGLHLRAGSSPGRTFQIHGNVFFMRCSRECSREIYPLPHGLEIRSRDDALPDNAADVLRCPVCGGLTRPHVLWFDETYDEDFYRFHSSLAVAGHTDLLIIVGTSGATNLPAQVAWTVGRQGGVIIDINIEQNPFSQLALKSRQGAFIRQPSGRALPGILDAFRHGGNR